MKNIVISATKGSAPSMIKSMAVGKSVIDVKYNTCHESFCHGLTQNSDRINIAHTPARLELNADVGIWIYINPLNIKQICQRIVVLNFLYTDDPVWMNNNWCWTPQLHNRLAGPDWPKYSKLIIDYPTWCLNEICQVAYDLCKPWTVINPDYEIFIDSNEFFGPGNPTTMQRCFEQINCQLDLNFVKKWRKQNFKFWKDYESLFTWQVPT